MSPALALDAPTERVAVNPLRHLEWQHDGFSLVFVFADVGRSLQLADWLDQRLAMQGRALHRHEAKDSFVRDPDAAVDALVVDEVVGRYYTARKPGEYRVLDEDFGTEDYGVGTRKDDVELMARLQKTLDEMKNDGSAAAISTKWFGKDIIKK
jgi:hypothetical protein